MYGTIPTLIFILDNYFFNSANICLSSSATQCNISFGRIWNRLPSKQIFIISMDLLLQYLWKEIFWVQSCPKLFGKYLSRFSEKLFL